MSMAVVPSSLVVLLEFYIARGAPSLILPRWGNVVKLSEMCDDSFRDEVSQVAQDSEVSQVSRMR